MEIVSRSFWNHVGIIYSPVGKVLFVVNVVLYCFVVTMISATEKGGYHHWWKKIPLKNTCVLQKIQWQPPLGCHPGNCSEVRNSIQYIHVWIPCSLKDEVRECYWGTWVTSADVVWCGKWTKTVKGACWPSLLTVLTILIILATNKNTT